MAQSQEESRLLAGTELAPWDIVVITLYFIIVIAVGLGSSLKNRGSVGGYFLAGRSVNWLLVGASLFASNIGSGHFVGLAGSGASSGIGIAVFELNAIFILMMLGWIFVPVYISAGVYTMPEYLRKRFGGQRIRIYLAVLALLLYIFTKISADLYAGAIFIKQSLQWDLYLAILLLLGVSAIFTITGGLTAVIWTDAIQTVIMVCGAFALMTLGLIQAGGYDKIVQDFFQAVPNKTNQSIYYDNSTGQEFDYNNCGIPPANSMNLLRAADDGGLPWPGVIFGLTISSVWYWCSDQVIVQRALAAKDLSHAKGGCILAGYLKILPMWLLVIPGMIARILFPETVGCAVPEVCQKVCNNPKGCTDIAYPMLVLKLMPEGARGLMLAVMMAALMSSLTSIFNSGSTIFTMDIWRRIRRNASDIELMIVGRVFVLFLVAVGVVWIPVVQSGGELFHYIQAVTSFLAPPVCAVYVLAVLFKRINEKGAFVGLLVGLVIGLIRFGWEYSYTTYPCGQESLDQRPPVISKVHYLHFGIILFAIVIIVTTVVSLLTKPIDEKHLVRLTYFSRYDTRERIDIPDSNDKKAVKKKDKITMTDIESSGEVNEGYQSNTTPAASTDNIADGPQVAEDDEIPDAPCWKRTFWWICGIERMQKTMTQEEAEEAHKQSTSIEETPVQNAITSLNAVILMIIASFIWGFWH